MKLSLMVLSPGKSEGQAIPVTLAQFIIGRDPECNLRPASAMISKRHCALLVRGGQVFLRDFDSTNGTFINDVPVKGEVPIKHDDILKVGPLSFKLVIQGQPAPVKPTPPPPPAKPKFADAPDDDSAAALLLSIDDGEPSLSSGLNADDESVPGGSTIMDIPAFLSPQQEKEKAEAEAKKETAKKPASKNDDAQTAAKSILDRYRKGGQRK